MKSSFFLAFFLFFTPSIHAMDIENPNNSSHLEQVQENNNHKLIRLKKIISISIGYLTTIGLTALWITGVVYVAQDIKNNHSNLTFFNNTFNYSSPN